MENKSKKEAIEDLLGIEDENIENTKKTQIMEERSGLIERVDKIYITNEGKQLLREQY